MVKAMEERKKDAPEVQFSFRGESDPEEIRRLIEKRNAIFKEKGIPIPEEAQEFFRNTFGEKH